MKWPPWLRTPTARALAELGEQVDRLAASVDALAAMQRKEAEQLKNLRKAFGDRERSWDDSVRRAAEAVAADLRRAGEAQRRGDAAWQRTFTRLDERLRADQKWRGIFKSQLTAVVRRFYLPFDRLPPPLDLAARRFRLRSQNEEDGILFALLERAGWGGQRFVEIGSGASGGNAAVLAHDCGWTGLMIEISEEAVVIGRRIFAANPGVTFLAARIVPDNVNEILTRHGFVGEVDLLSIDIDSYDYWILEALTVCSPRILMLEYNALFGAERRVTIPLSQPVDAAPKGYGGASLAALAALAGRKGYRLVVCEDAGVNAFFLRHDVAPDVPGVSVAQAFRPLRWRAGMNDEEVATDIYDVAARAGLPLMEV